MNTPITVDVWQEVDREFTSAAVKKATTGIHAAFAELARKPGNVFTLLVAIPAEIKPERFVCRRT